MDYNAILNGGMGLGGGIGAMPVAAPYTTGGLVPGGLLQGGNLPGVFGAALSPELREQMLNIPGKVFPGMNNDVMEQAKGMPNQYPGSGQEMADKINAADKAKGEMDAYKMMAQGIQGAARNMQMPMPSGNTAQIMRDQNQFRFAGTPQQQMAQALRRR